MCTKLIHHPMIDVRTPLNPNGRDELWALIGHVMTSSPMFLPDTIFHEVQGVCPPFKDMATAGNAADFISLMPSVGLMMRGSELPFHGKWAIVLPPFLAKAFMDVDTEDAAELALVGCKVLQDFDAQTAQGECGPVEESKEGDPDSSEGPTPAQSQCMTVAFCYVIQFLYLIVVGHLSGHPPEVLMILQATDWAAQMMANKLGALSGTLGSVEGSSLGSHMGSTPNSAFHWQQVGAAISCFTTAVDKHALAQAASTEKEHMSKGHANKLPEWIQKMVINALEPIADGTTDDDGDPVTDHTTFVASYQQFLDQPSSGATKQFLNHYLNDKKMLQHQHPTLDMCCLVLRQSPVDGSYEAMLSMEAASLHLKLAEGFGLSAADVAKVTKILLMALTSMDVLTKMCAVFSMLLALTLGEKAPATTAFLEQCNDFHDNKESYWMRATVDTTFPLQVAIYLDQCFQLYLSDCVHAETPDEVDEKWLSFHSMWKEIMLGTFQVQHVPSSLLDQLQSLPSGHDKCHGHPQGDVYDDDDMSPLQA